jgi:CHAT domain-containing protein/tetratricopeptide (TPR) repeat protein
MLSAQSAPEKTAELIAQGERLSSDSKYDQATTVFEAALKLARENGDVPNEAAALFGIAGVEELRSDYPKARIALDNCLALRQQLGKPGDIGATLNSMGNVENARGDNAAALKFYQRALPLREEAGDRSGVAGTLNNIGTVFRKIGDYQQALEYLMRSEKELTALGKDRGRVVVLGNIAQAYGFLGDYPRALDYNSQSLEIAQKLGDRQQIARALNLDGVLQNWRGNYRGAMESIQKSLKLWQETGREWGVAESLNNIGEVYQSQADHKQAIQYFSRSIAICRKIGNRSLESDGHKNKGAGLLALRRPSEAMKEFELGYKLSASVGEKVVISISLYDMAQAQMQLGRSAEAIRYLERAAEIQTGIGDRRDLADTRTRLADNELRLGHPKAALRIAREAEEIAAAVDRQDALWQAKLVAGKALRRLSKDGEAQTEFDGAIETIESLHLHVAGPVTAVSTYFADKLEPYRERMALAVSQGNVNQALTFAERSRARALTQILGNGRTEVPKSLTAHEIAQKETLQNQLASLNILAAHATETSSPEEIVSLRTRLARARNEWDSFETTLLAAHPDFAAQGGVSGVIGGAEMQKLAIQTGALIITYAVTPRVTYVFVQKPGAKTRVFPIRITAASLSRATREFRRQIISSDLGLGPTAQEMFQLLLSPLADELSRYPALIVLPDGPLWDVPFQALQPRPNHYLIEDTAISYVPSLSVLSDTMRRGPQRSGAFPSLLALGDPVTSSADRLPEAERQVRQIQKLYGEQHSRVLTGSAATEEMFKAEVGNYTVVHLASHAILDDASPMYSHVLLAVAPSGHEDGMLDAREMMDLNLHAEMVVLSACETARGEAVAGEGITGMLWAMFVAGSPTTVASLWRVESASTSELMIEFHRQWLQNRRAHVRLSKASAMRTAARKLIATPRYSHPFYWAGFIVAGSPL